MHFQELFSRLDDWNAIVRRLLADPTLSDEDREKQFVEAALLDLRRTVGEEEARKI